MQPSSRRRRLVRAALLGFRVACPRARVNVYRRPGSSAAWSVGRLRRSKVSGDGELPGVPGLAVRAHGTAIACASHPGPESARCAGPEHRAGRSGLVSRHGERLRRIADEPSRGCAGGCGYIAFVTGKGEDGEPLSQTISEFHLARGRVGVRRACAVGYRRDEALFVEGVRPRLGECAAQGRGDSGPAEFEIVPGLRSGARSAPGAPARIRQGPTVFQAKLP